MKYRFAAAYLLFFSIYSSAQTTSPSPTPEQPGLRNFGWSLKEKENDNRRKKADRNTPATSKAVDADSEIIKVRTDLVVSDALVTDPNGSVVTGLEKKDFIITEDGVPQILEVFSRGENAIVPRSIVLLIDHLPLESSYLKMSVAAAKTLVDQLAAQDKMAIVTADTTLRLGFTADKTLLRRTLDDIEKKGIEYARWYIRGGKQDDKNFEDISQYPTSRQINQFQALMAVLNEMFQEDGRQRIVIFQGDGIHMIWLKPDKDLPYPVTDTTRMETGMKYLGREKAMSKFGFSDVKESVERSRATVYSVATGMRFFGLSDKERMARAPISFKKWADAMGIDNSKLSWDANRRFIDREETIRTAGQAAMYRVAELSGGNTAMMEKPEDATRVYSDIFATIKSRYVMGYYPTDSKQGERPRNVTVEVRGHPEYVIDTRKTYILQ